MVIVINSWVMFILQKRPGSPKQHERLNAKPPLPDNGVSQFRKGAYHQSLDFVQSLCDTSYGLVDVFPVEDRKSALCEVVLVLTCSILFLWCDTFVNSFPSLTFTFVLLVSSGDQCTSSWCSKQWRYTCIENLMHESTLCISLYRVQWICSVVDLFCHDLSSSYRLLRGSGDGFPPKGIKKIEEYFLQLSISCLFLMHHHFHLKD